MITSKSVLKRERQNKARTSRNKIIKSRVHTSFIKMVKAIESNDKKIIEENLKKYIQVIDKAVKRGLIQRNKAARLKSRINKRIKQPAKYKENKPEKVTPEQKDTN